jgi:hypothetical protein
VSYLTSRSELAELVDLLSGLGRYHEAGLVSYKQALALTNGSSVESRYAPILKIFSP